MNFTEFESFENVTIPMSLIEDTLELLLNPKRIISDSNEIVLDWNKRTEVYNRLFDVMKKCSSTELLNS